MGTSAWPASNWTAGSMWLIKQQQIYQAIVTKQRPLSNETFFFVSEEKWMIGQVVSVRVYTMKASDFPWSYIILLQLGVRHQNDKARGNRLPLLTRCKKQYLFSVLVCPSNSLESCRIFYLWAMFCGRLQWASWSATSDDGAAHTERIMYSHVLIW